MPRPAIPAHPRLERIRRRWAPLLLAVACASTPSYATTADDLCASDADPCVVNEFVTVDDGSVLDLGTRALRVIGRLDVRSGSMTIHAGLIEVLTDGQLRGRGDASHPGGNITATAGTLELIGSIDTSGAPPGRIDFTIADDLHVSGSIHADSLSSSNAGGVVSLTAGAVAITGPVTAHGGGGRLGGDIGIQANADMLIAAMLDSSGGSGGTIDLSTVSAGDGGLLISEVGELHADATTGGNDGGEITLSTSGAGTIEVRGAMSALGRGSVDGGGDGGSMDVDAAADLVVTESASVQTNAGSPDGTGGEMDLFSSGAIRIAGRIELRGPGNEADGGDLTVDSDGNTEIAAMVDARAGGGLGGSVDVSVSGDSLAVTRNARVDASSSGSGTGGGISLTSDGLLSVAGILVSDGGSSTDGRGGLNTLDGCTMDIAASAVLSSQRTRGSNVILSRGNTLIAGTLRADPAMGRNQFRFAGPPQEPVLLGTSVINPAPLRTMDDTVQPCGPVVGPTLTPTPTPGPPTPTPTATATPVACRGDCDGNLEVTIDELVDAVLAALSGPPFANCGVDTNGDSLITIDELIAAVAAAIDGCR